MTRDMALKAQEVVLYYRALYRVLYHYRSASSPSYFLSLLLLWFQRADGLHVCPLPALACVEMPSSSPARVIACNHITAVVPLRSSFQVKVSVNCGRCTAQNPRQPSCRRRDVHIISRAEYTCGVVLVYELQLCGDGSVWVRGRGQALGVSQETNAAGTLTWARLELPPAVHVRLWGFFFR